MRSLLSRYLRWSECPVDQPTNRDLFIKDGYVARVKSRYFEDILTDTEKGIVHQPDVYPFAAFIARRLGCSHIIDIGCGQARKLSCLHPEFHIYGIDYGSNIQFCKQRYPFGRWQEYDLDAAGLPPIDRDLLRQSVIVCADVIEHLRNPLNLLRGIRDWLNDAPVALLTTPERDLVHGERDEGPPANASHIREWNLSELRKLVDSLNILCLFEGLTVNNSQDLEKKTSIMVLANSSDFPTNAPPGAFRVVAIMTAYNEEDIIVPTISELISQGVEVYLIDNWSSDATRARAETLLGKGLIGIERFPIDSPSKFYDWELLLGRVETLAEEIRADWFIHHDADEVRESPWPLLKLKDAIYRVDCAGFNAIDHTVVVFSPVDNGFVPETSFKDYFSVFEFGRGPAHSRQIKAWKNLGRRIVLTTSGGHDAMFESRRIYPFNFLLRHYPVRSQNHGEKKIFRERIPRFNPAERLRGWHRHYDSVSPEHSFLKHIAEMERFDARTFHRRYVVERLSRVGIVRSGSMV
jgi:glycosyltransferase involved in cell wall biosynthesis